MRGSERIQIFCDEIWQWFSRHKRVLPWRDIPIADADERAYRIFVSEIMLQQTQVSRVQIVFRDFLIQFPQINDLARATNREVLLAWRGMGYNSRALRLRDAACTIVERFHGRFPQSMEELQSISGVGHYTAAAIRNFAFGIPTPCLDTNIRRILHRTFVGRENPDGTWKKDDRYLLRLAEKVLNECLQTYSKKARRSAGLAGSRAGAAPPKGKGWSTEGKPLGFSSVSSDWHSALMDFGSLVCTKSHPKWDQYSERLRSITKAYGSEIKRTKKLNKTEPGRLIEERFIPNRIIRGRIVDYLRDQERGGSIFPIGKAVAADWNRVRHEAWLKKILEGLERDGLIEKKGTKYRLKD